MISYDPTIIQQYATELYERASRIVMASTAGCAMAGFVLALTARSVGAGSDLFTVLLTGGGAGLGWYTGQAKAFQLRLQAQQALCQLQIEVNTRPDRSDQSDETQEHYRPVWGRAPGL